jgi:excisionase family DNA binding protein
MAKLSKATVGEIEELFTPKEYAERRKCSISTVRAKILRGDLEIVKLGRLVRIPARELAREIAEGTRPRREVSA